ncbi:MAG: SCO family protein [Anaerolineales bacterium]|nr:SCO family protein [Anaerolineales bacterium]
MDRKLIWIGGGILVLIAFGVLFSIFFAKPLTFRGTSYAEPFPPAPEIDLKKADGTTFKLSEQKGKVTLLFFGYTSCPDFCPTTLAEMKQVLDALDNDAEKVQVVFVTVDPEKDTSEKMQEYVNRFNSSFIGLSGSQAELQTIWTGYGIFRAETDTETALGKVIDHTVRLYLIDLDGNLRLSYAYGTPYQDVVADIELLLSQAK